MRRFGLALAALLTILAVCACGNPKPQRYGSCGPILLVKHRYGCAPPPPTAPQSTVGPYFTAPTVSSASCSAGCAVVGQTLGVTTGTWTNSPTSYTYQWDRCSTTSAQPPTTGSCAAISGATSSAYTVQSADSGYALVPTVTAHNAGGSTSTSLTGTCDSGEMLGAVSQSGVFTANLPSSAPAGCSPVSAVAATTQASETFCTNAVTTCGYADPMNQTAGVPSNVTPSTTSGNCATYTGGGTISSGTVTINGCKITGQITITGGNVTIENSDLSVFDQSGASAPIRVDGSATVAVNYDTLHGLGNTDTGSMAWAVWNQASGTVTIDHSYLYDGDRIAMNDGPSVTVTNSFCWSNAQVVYSGQEEHYECIYDAPPNSVTAKNNTLLNVQYGASAAFFVDAPPSGSAGGTVDLENNLLGGGSYCVYGGGSNAPTESYLDNRFTRAWHPLCGISGLDAYNSTGTLTVSGNTYDDTGASASP